MRGVLRTLLVLLIVAAMPMRAFAAIGMAVCEAHHLGAPEQAQFAAPVHGADHDHAVHDEPGSDEGTKATLSVCSMCSGCCVGTSAAPDFARVVVVFEFRPDPIPFFDSRAPAHVPERLDRPPLSL